MLKNVSLVAVALVLALVSGGCECTKDECKEKHSLMDCTKQECKDKYGLVDPGTVIGPDGPDVIVGAGGGSQLVWTINGAPATDGGTVFTGDPNTECQLRKDIVGKVVKSLTYIRKRTNTTHGANYIELESSTMLLRFAESSSGGLTWWIRNKSTGKSCTLRPGNIPGTPTDLPLEFLGFTTSDTFKEVNDNEDATRVDFKVQY